jgi:hypothetical protein
MYVKHDPRFLEFVDLIGLPLGVPEHVVNGSNIVTFEGGGVVTIPNTGLQIPVVPVSGFATITARMVRNLGVVMAIGTGPLRMIFLSAPYGDWCVIAASDDRTVYGGIRSMVLNLPDKLCAVYYHLADADHWSDSTREEMRSRVLGTKLSMEPNHR